MAASSAAGQQATVGDESSSALNIVLHPAVIVSITDHYTRARANTKTPRPRVVGGLVGTQRGRTIEMHSAYELLVSEDADGGLVFDMEFLRKKHQLIVDVQEEYQFLGWYSTGTAPSAADLAVQTLLREEGINESPLYMVLDPTPPPGTKELPIDIYESELRIIDDSPTYRFVHTAYSIYSGESERIAVDHVAHLSSVATAESSSSVTTHAGGIANAVENLSGRLAIILRYLKAVQAGTAEADPRILRMVKAVVLQLPVATTGAGTEFDLEFVAQYNDTLLTTYLATLTKAASAVNNMVDKFNVVATSDLDVAAFQSAVTEWLETAWTAVDAATATSAVLVVGNEAADVDSVVCALAWAYTLRNKAIEGCVVLPVIGVPAAELPLRTEVTALLAATCIDASLFAYPDTVQQVVDAVGRDAVTIHLVDHNVVRMPALVSLGSAVNAIIDHHTDEGAHDAAAPRRIETVGSCATLVTEMIEAGNLPPPLAFMLLATVLVDTVNLAPEAGKVTSADEAATRSLCQAIAPCGGGDDHVALVNTLFEQMQAAKFDVSALSCAQLLARDAKYYTTPAGLGYAIPGVFLNGAEFVVRAGGATELAIALSDYAAAKHAHFVVVMLTQPSDSGVSREMIVYVPASTPDASTLLNRLVDFLVSVNNSELQLQTTAACSDAGSTDAGVIVHLAQGNATASRKRIAPLLVEFTASM
ncbi:uncharacterized protein AMSG_12073 [Thecamonas trahens ATCC 50062]|uniref:MPN domain-containing protein n=1 Tax=Thecamonas trahens ATCC 50062 TaxID=461836 RepID=A0A0L0DGZ3_THETB|nr:hypothetical protein AMSG_12073 [Thecamonas trahens ATCC 50062]KNC51582.1 hypothetical protein AMSG_12073 [Thecamonas trahens ATCC 50062]|eukprot:XP_013756037.1 hypothetical protein AMSG_12073 [Thecamonas trahens ATCC 50062]